jgi:hypothetical protein
MERLGIQLMRISSSLIGCVLSILSMLSNLINARSPYIHHNSHAELYGFGKSGSAWNGWTVESRMAGLTRYTNNSD